MTTEIILAAISLGGTVILGVIGYFTRLRELRTKETVTKIEADSEDEKKEIKQLRGMIMKLQDQIEKMNLERMSMRKEIDELRAEIKVKDSIIDKLMPKK